VSATSGTGERRDSVNSQKDADLGLRPEAAPVAGSAESSPSLKYGILWEVCCIKTCAKIVGLKLGRPEDDGKLSHTYCPTHEAEAWAQVRAMTGGAV